jgi:hypothetical protein
MIMKINKFNVEESVLKENITLLSKELKEKPVEVSERRSNWTRQTGWLISQKHIKI